MKEVEFAPTPAPPRENNARSNIRVTYYNMTLLLAVIGGKTGPKNSFVHAFFSSI